MRDRAGIFWAGLGLIGLGISFLLAQWVGWDRIWPLFPFLGGLAFFVGYVVSGFKDPGLVFVGTAVTLVSLFFFGFSLGYWEWSEMKYLWPVFPLIGGLAFFALFAVERERDAGVLSVGCAAIIVGIAGLAFTLGFAGGEIIKLWPLLLVIVGLISLAGALLRMFRQG